MDDHLHDIRTEFRRHNNLSGRAMDSFEDTPLFLRPDAEVNPVALIVKHLAGILLSRWTDFLTTEGEKPDLHPDCEFLITQDERRASPIAACEHGWATLFAKVRDVCGPMAQAHHRSPGRTGRRPEFCRKDRTRAALGSSSTAPPRRSIPCVCPTHSS